MIPIIYYMCIFTWNHILLLILRKTLQVSALIICSYRWETKTWKVEVIHPSWGNSSKLRLLLRDELEISRKANWCRIHFLNQVIFLFHISQFHTACVSRYTDWPVFVWMVAWDLGVIDPFVFSACRPLGKVYRKLWARRKPESCPVVFPLWGVDEPPV